MTRIRAAFIALIIASVALAAYGDRIGGNGPEFMPRDPGAARKNLSNVDAATGRSALGLGTMATEASTDYVATGTFTGHTGDSSDPHGATLTQTTIISDSVDGVDVSAHITDNSDVHGCTVIASASAVADALSAANASDALLLRLNGSRAMTGNLKFAGGYGILRATNDESDNSYIWLSGGGDLNPDRGGCMSFFGNEYATVGGQVRYYAGNVSTGDHIFYTGANAERMRIKYSGNLLIGTVTDDGVNKLQVNGSVAISSFAQLASPTAIPTAAKGRIYFNGSESKFKKCTDGSNWVDM